VIDLVVPPAAHAQFARLLYDGAGGPATITPARQRFIDELLEKSGIHDPIRHGPAGLMPWYAALELEPGASWSDVRSQYRRLVRDYHPDRVANLAQGFIDYANERTTRLNEAYEALEHALNGPGLPTTAHIDLEDE